MALPQTAPSPDRVAELSALERRALWLASWTIHNANHLRPSRDGLKVGGHQASSASVATLLTALYFDVLRPEDRVAVKPHASPMLHAIQYMMGRQSLEGLMRFRGLGGAQSYPSRTKDAGEVDFSTGSVGLGVGVTLFASLVQEYVRLKKLAPAAVTPGRLIAVMGDAELDEGNVFEALLEGWKHDVRNLWWIIDYNRQSLDGVVSDRLFQKIKDFFGTVGWKIVLLKYGKALQAAFERPGGEALERWIDDCPNDLYSALVFKGQNGEPGVWRDRLLHDLKGVNGIPELLAGYDDAGLHRLMTNLAGHDMAAVLEAFHGAGTEVPHCFIAYTIKGHGTPLAGHKDNHAGLMSVEQMAAFKASRGIADGQEWQPFDEGDLPAAMLARLVRAAPYNDGRPRVHAVAELPVPAIAVPAGSRQSTQAAFGHILNDLAKGGSALAERIVTTSPDVTVSTNLGGWVNQRGIFARRPKDDVFRLEKVVSAQKWIRDHRGQHIELGIAENNLFLMLAALGLAGPMFGARLIPIGTLYDPFIARGLDALNYACYLDARFIVVATPSGITLAPEGGAHQSISTPLIGLAQPGLSSFEPAYADELAAILAWSFGHVQAPDGGSVYLRLSTRPLAQPARSLDAAAVIAGAYWQVEPAPEAEVALVYSGAVAPEVLAAQAAIAEDIPGCGVLAVPSADRLFADWQARGRDSHLARLLSRLGPGTALVTVQDGHPAGLAWLGATGRRVIPLGVSRFGQSGDIPDLYREYGIDTDAILAAAARAVLERR
ncbi:MAG: transketolase [Thalassobaculales bacterium]